MGLVRALIMGCLMLAIAGSGAAQAGQKEIGGLLLGGALGGFLGSKVGKGKGKLAATAAGTLFGAFLGSQVGRSLDQTDRLYAERTARGSLERSPTGTTSDWVNPDTGHAGSFTPTKTYRTRYGQNCRDYSQTVTVDGRTETAYGTACRSSDGTWRLVNE